MYRGGRPNALARLLNRLSAVQFAIPLLSSSRWATLQVRGRRSGRLVSFPVVVADYAGQRYLVAMLGQDTNWVHNVRAAGGRAVLWHGRRMPVQLEEVEPSARAPILRRYLEVGPGARPHFPVDRRAGLKEFEQIAAQYPVFRITEAGQETVAPDVYRLETRRFFTEANVYLVRSGAEWVLIDTAWPGSAQLIRAAAESLFGPGTRPAAILLTHIHPDHSGSALELARAWNLPVHVHPAEMPLARGGIVPAYANPLDRWFIGPILRLIPRRRLEAARARRSLEGTARPFDPESGVPGLPDWRCVPTPGHTPGHVAYFRERDRVLITGDAVLTVNLNSVRDLLAKRHRIAGPPRVSTWDWSLAKESVATLAALEPNVLATGHGRPIAGPETARSLRDFAARFSGPTVRRALR